MFIKNYLIALSTFLVIDMVWLGVVAQDFYESQIGFLMKDQPNWIAAILFYLLFIVGLVVFVINPALSNGSWLQALGLGALFGLICYATYDLTNLSTLEDWPVYLTVVDLIWGGTLAGSVSFISYFISNGFSL